MKPGFPCKGVPEEGFNLSYAPENKQTSIIAAAWMLQNKPAYYTGKAMCDIPHLPMELRSL